MELLDNQKIALTINNLKAFIKEQGLGSLYVPSFDQYLSEYVPLEDCPRYFVTGFTGSVAEVLITEDKNYLFVDGRYHEHAEIECDPKLVDIVKCEYGVSNFSALKEKASEACGVLGIFASRTPYNSFVDLEKDFKVKSFSEDTISSLISFGRPTLKGEVNRIPSEIYGQRTAEKLETLITGDQACFVSATDSLAWLSNCRGYQIPYMSSFKGKGLGLKGELHIFVPSKDALSKEVIRESDLHFYLLSEMEEVLTSKLEDIEEVVVDPLAINTQDFRFLKGLKSEQVLEKPNYLVKKQALKNACEMKHIEESFEKSNQVIFNALKWVKNRVEKGDELFEYDFFENSNKLYKEAGSISNSFGTIAGSGPNSSIIHYKNPSKEKKIVSGELILLDSGGYYEGGYATDTTRTVLSGGEATSEQKTIYTLVMKGWLAAMYAEFPVGTLGKEIDAIARKPIQDGGYDYAHGTGHGIGVHVHEGGYSVTPQSEVELQEGTHGSIEPGIYIPGVGGVRTENAVFVESHPDKEGILRFKNLTWIGLDHDLIDHSLLNEKEANWLEEYEAECTKRGRSFK